MASVKSNQNSGIGRVPHDFYVVSSVQKTKRRLSKRGFEVECIVVCIQATCAWRSLVSWIVLPEAVVSK